MGGTSPCDDIDVGALMGHTQALAQWVKLSGSPEEAESLHHVQRTLAGFGYATRVIHHPALISLPGPASVTIGGIRLRAITQSFARPSAGLAADLVYLGAGTAADFAATQVKGRIVLVDGIATPAVSLRASQAGAAGQLHVSPQEHLHEMCISPVWGSPRPDQEHLLPTTVVCTIGLADGMALRERLRAGETIQASLRADVDTGWRQTPILEGRMDAPGSDGSFVLFSAHHDTWHHGVMDNGTANAVLLELARLCAARQPQWRRSLRVCFWSGHSHGRFSGSSWYADTYWAELDRCCVAHVNVDSPGARGATNLANTGAMTPLAALAAEAVQLYAGQQFAGRRMPRGADMSFSGIGIPAIFGDMSEPEDSPIMPHSWWWHTPEDLLDKIDPAILLRDARVCLHGLWRLLTDPILPLDPAAHVQALLTELKDIRSEIPLDGLIADAARLCDAVSNLTARPVNAGVINLALLRLCRALVPLDYTSGDRFTHDPALPLLPWAALQALRGGSGDGAHLAALRACNVVQDAIRRAHAALAASG